MSRRKEERPPPYAGPAPGEDTSVVGVLAERALEIRARPLGEQLEDAARRAFVDWLGVTVGGSRGAAASALIDGLGTEGGASRIVGRGMAPASVAALVNGTSAHTLELDDIYAPGLFHPGAPIVSAGLAAADQFDVPAGVLWRAIVTGYEIGCRVAADLGPAHYVHWHTTGTAGAVGAAAAAAEVRQADPARFAHALSLAATMAGGLQQTFRSDAMGKPLHAGAAAQAGVVAAAAAMGGVTGAADVLEGSAGLAAATGSMTSWSHSRAALARPFAVEAVTVKPYACCGHAFAAIDAALELRSDGVLGQDIGRLEVATYSTALTVAGIARPDTDAERRFSIPYLVAAALVTGRAGVTVEDPAHQPEIRRLAGRVQLMVDPVFDERFPSRRGARVTAVTQDGTRRAAEVPDRSGSPENPLTTPQIERKFLAACAPVIGESGQKVLNQFTDCGESVAVRALQLGRL